MILNLPIGIVIKIQLDQTACDIILLHNHTIPVPQQKGQCLGSQNRTMEPPRSGYN